MATDKAPAFQFYPRDYLGDFDVAAMTLEEAGAYSMLLSFSWLKCGLPNDHRKLARALGVTPARFERLWETIGAKFEAGDDGKLRNSRQEREREKQEISRKRREGAALARWEKAEKRRKAREERKQSTCNAHAMQCTSSSTSTASSTAVSSVPVADATPESGPSLMTVYHDGFVAKFGTKPKIDGGKDGKLLKALIQSHGRPTVMACLGQFFRSSDPFIAGSGYTIGVFSSVFNKLLIEIRGGNPDRARASPRTSGNLAALDRFISRGKQGEVIDGPFSPRRLRAGDGDAS